MFPDDFDTSIIIHICDRALQLQAEEMKYDVSFYFAVGDRIKFNFVRYIVEKVAQNLVDQVWLLI